MTKQVTITTDIFELQYWLEIGAIPFQGNQVATLLAESVRQEMLEKLERKHLLWKQKEPLVISRAKKRKLTLSNHYARVMLLTIMMYHKPNMQSINFKDSCLEYLKLNISKSLA